MRCRVAILLGCLLAAAVAAAEMPMAKIAGGRYARPLEKSGQVREVPSFYLDVRQVTNAEYLAFVKLHPEWQRTRVNRLFADNGYLRHWAGDTELGPLAPSEAPVTNVSWFAARAFLKAQGKRLPTLDEWEFVARADERRVDATGEGEFRKRILTWYSKPMPEVLPSAESMPANIYGVRGMHGLVWEWTSNFVASMSGGESRSDGSPEGPLFCGGAATDPNQAIEYADFMRVAFRSSLQGSFCLGGLGFRGAKDASDSIDPSP
ncbi:formylglycine-generating enzyme family protein [Luteolibacter luteus]|uniref:Formylglycine-generating enzyme family protein n=1 Tax=Luteolibacter luteus TaxID=2728835 RepID=A0A858RG49_9BACT|nr:formylglycine-generating enzyme family protein [Luteolibacter luteus]QJE95113.1 formylglycine-generating enzyme family protein [Luteolibacter luteus]